MRGSLLEGENQHQDVSMLDRQTEIQRKMNNSNDFQSDVHPQHLPGSPHTLGLQHNRQVGIMSSYSTPTHILHHGRVFHIFV